jgi:hypothetical protein
VWLGLGVWCLALSLRVQRQGWVGGSGYRAGHRAAQVCLPLAPPPAPVPPQRWPETLNQTENQTNPTHDNPKGYGASPHPAATPTGLLCGAGFMHSTYPWFRVRL